MCGKGIVVQMLALGQHAEWAWLRCVLWDGPSWPKAADHLVAQNMWRADCSQVLHGMDCRGRQVLFPVRRSAVDGADPVKAMGERVNPTGRSRPGARGPRNRGPRTLSESGPDRAATPGENVAPGAGGERWVRGRRSRPGGSGTESSHSRLNVSRCAEDEGLIVTPEDLCRPRSANPARGADRGMKAFVSEDPAFGAACSGGKAAMDGYALAAGAGLLEEPSGGVRRWPCQVPALPRWAFRGKPARRAIPPDQIREARQTPWVGTAACAGRLGFAGRGHGHGRRSQGVEPAGHHHSHFAGALDVQVVR